MKETEEQRENIMLQVQEAREFQVKKERIAWIRFYAGQDKFPPIGKQYGIPKEDLSRYLCLEFSKEPEKLAVIMADFPDLEIINNNLGSVSDRKRFVDCTFYTSYHHMILN